MKKVFATLCLVASTLALSACGTTGTTNTESNAPYAQGRTATYDSASAASDVAPAEEVFQRAQ
jgi:predicted small lipoprotein YifL